VCHRSGGRADPGGMCGRVHAVCRGAVVEGNQTPPAMVGGIMAAKEGGCVRDQYPKAGGLMGEVVLEEPKVLVDAVDGRGETEAAGCDRVLEGCLEVVEEAPITGNIGKRREGGLRRLGTLES